MELQNTTEKPLKEFSKFKSAGNFLEEKISKSIHLNSIPILISSHLLRELGAGQIDIARFKTSKLIEIFEIKNTCYPNKIQMRRLKKSQDLISQLLDCEVSLKIFVNTHKTKSDSL